MTNASRTLYTGMTSDLEKRVWDHKHKTISGFTAKYNITLLVWYESTNDVDEAILLERKIKGKRRDKKIALIESSNPNWVDLAVDWYEADCFRDAKEILRSLISIS